MRVSRLSGSRFLVPSWTHGRGLATRFLLVATGYNKLLLWKNPISDYPSVLDLSYPLFRSSLRLLPFEIWDGNWLTGYQFGSRAYSCIIFWTGIKVGNVRSLFSFLLIRIKPCLFIYSRCNSIWSRESSGDCWRFLILNFNPSKRLKISTLPLIKRMPD